MQTKYSRKNNISQRIVINSSASVLDNSAQSESLQRKADMANAAQRVEAPRPNNTGMPDNLKAGIESLSGFSMDDVRVHYNSSKPATVQALAYTQGTDIHVAPGQEKCLPHEAWHVAQQMAGRVSPTTNINGMPVNDNAALEHEADVMGEKAVQCKETDLKGYFSKTLQCTSGLIQCLRNVDLICAADVFYVVKSGSSDIPGKAKGTGFNDINTKENVIKVFQNARLKNLSELKAAQSDGDRKNVSNPPGKCAEPHAVADALVNVGLNFGVDLSNDGHLPENVSIQSIIVSDAVVRRYKYKEEGKRDINQVFNKYEGEDISKDPEVLTYERCPTCKQWIDDDGCVRDFYLQKDEAPPEVDFSEPNFVKKVVKKISDTAFHNVRFLNSQLSSLEPFYSELPVIEKIDSDGRIKSCKGEKEQLVADIPRIISSDDEIKAIDEKNGLRTVIKKKMLKRRIEEKYGTKKNRSFK
ncbi:protein of unknown function [Fibrobacter sp. UWH4]|nr:DUF4157 domain-containing protein [Fibrobacter sp. UWH4]SHL83297.1 protein of unknown function [Fibrobacter sp. UWH4]